MTLLAFAAVLTVVLLWMWIERRLRLGAACCRRAVQQSIDIACPRAHSSKPAARCRSDRFVGRQAALPTPFGEETLPDVHICSE